MSRNDRRRERRKRKDIEVKAYTDDQMKIIVDSIKSVKTKRPRDYFYLMLVVYTGARRCEILDLKGEDLRGGYCHVIANKGSRDRAIPLPSEFYSDLVAWGAGRDYLFDMGPETASNLIKRHLPRGCRISKPLHAIRHWMGIRIYEETGDIKVVADILGHVNIRNTLVYMGEVNTEGVRNLWDKVG